MRKIFICLLFISFSLYSQKEANIWYFGNNAGLDFNKTPVEAITDGQINTLEGCSSFSDENGNLLFYSDGIFVYTKTHQIMKYTNGNLANNLRGNPSSTQSGMIIPKPKSSTIFYLFTVDNGPSDDFFAYGLNYYTIDMSLNNGEGELIDEDNDGTFFTNLSSGLEILWTEKVAAVRGKQCDSYWVVSSSRNDFHAFKIDENGVNNSPVISRVNNTTQRRGYLKLSPDGTKLAIANQGDDALIYDFDNDTGVVSNNGIFLINLGDTFFDGEPYGVEFSVDSQKVYITTVSGFRRFLVNSAVSYKLFQFDLTTTDIPASKYLIHSQIAGSTDYPQGGYRGALQLGPDSKIYVTIPLTYEDTNGFTEYLDLIENPNSTGSDVIFKKNSIYLGGRYSTQGLPPFISSLLLPIKITNANNGQVINNQDIPICIGQNLTLSPEKPTGSSIPTYQWSFDDGTTKTDIPNPSNSPDLNLTNITVAQEGKYKLSAKLVDNCSNITELVGIFNVKTFEASSAKKPINIDFCDLDATTPNTFNLNTKDTEILDRLSNTTFDVLYYDTLDKANKGVSGTELSTSYELNTVGTKKIYARVHNKNAAKTCFAITDFDIIITGVPVPVQPTPYRVCDDAASGSDTDTVSGFLLKSKDSEILGTLDATLYSITYHTTLTGAKISKTTDAIDKNVNYQVTNTEKVYVRVENIASSKCFVVSEDVAGSTFKPLELTVNPLPILKTNQAQIRQCINTNNGLSTINLTTAQINISDNPNGTFEFYEDSAGTTKISNFTSYPVDANSNPPKSVWVKAISEFGCDSKLVELILTIGTAADRPYDETFIACDDFLDTDGNDTPGSNSDTDGITLFQLNKTAVIANINTNSNIDVFFYETEKDRQEATNTIDIANYRNKNIPNSTGNKFPIYYRLINKINNDCTGIGQIYLQIQPVPLAFTPNDFIFCDDVLSGSTTDGENIGTNLRTRVPDILGATQTETAFSVSFHTTKNGAITNADIITNETDFRNTAPSTFSPDSPSEQIIYVRVENKNTTLTCINPHVSFKIIVNPLPTIAAAVTPLSVCDITTPTDANAKNRIAENIDLTTKNTEILAGKTNHKITFFTTQAHADAGTPVIANPTNFTNDLIHTVFPSNLQSDDPGRQTIYYTITQEIGNQCTSVVASFNVDVYPEPNLPTTITDYSVCDNISDSFGSDANGFNGDIALKTKVSEILVNYQPNKHSDFKVGFYSNLADAKSGNTTKEINQDVYQNIQKSETVFVRVENIKNTGITCANTKLSFNIEVTPLPSFTVLGEENIDNPQILCLNNLPFILDVESPLGNYSYQWRNEAGIIIGNQRKLTIAAEGKYTVTATDISPNTCTRTRTTVVKASNVANLLDAFVEISDESTALGSGQNIAVKIDTINNNLGPGAYQFALLNTETNERIPSLGFQDEPLFEEIEGGIYTVIVNDKNGCSPDAMLTISVIQFPKFFTPNGDGWNDFWKIKGVSKTFYSSRILNIFDRFGRLLTQVPFDEKGWDGTINGNILSTNDYWFDIQIVPIDTNKSPIYKKGHFTLLRR